MPTISKRTIVIYPLITDCYLPAAWVNATTESVCEKVIFAYGSAWPSINRLTSASWGTAATPNCTPWPAWVESYAYNGPGAVTAKTLSMDTRA